MPLHPRHKDVSVNPSMSHLAQAEVSHFPENSIPSFLLMASKMVYLSHKEEPTSFQR